MNVSSITDSTTALDRSPSILSSNRPPSPTKGLGGFVESAMMKRSDSVNKRWSVRANNGLKRGDSVAGARPPSSLHNRGLSKELQTTRDNTPSSPLASSRPGSSHVSDPISPPLLQDLTSTAEQQENIEDREKNVEPTKNSDAVPTQQVVSRPETPPNDSQLAVGSPSKTMDPRRWSPTKSTWLESALQAKPEPPKLQPLREDQPKWKVDLQRSRSRASRDISPEKTKHRDEQTPTAVKSSTPRIFEPKVASVQDLNSPAPNEDRERPPAVSKPNGLKATNASTSVAPTPIPKQFEDTPPVAHNLEEKVQVQTRTETQNSAVSEITDKTRPVVKPKPQTPPKTDFRATLRSRTAGPTPSTGEEPEFRSMFGKLKRATTQNYVAPDELKSNILSGKAALNVTDGPQKPKRVDEFKETILAKKEEMKVAGTKPDHQTEPKEKPEEPIPEALVRRKTLSKASAPNLVMAGSVMQPVPAKPELKVKKMLNPVDSTAPSAGVKQEEKPLVHGSMAAAPSQESRTAPKPSVPNKTSVRVPSATAEPAILPLVGNKATSISSQAVETPPLSTKAVDSDKVTISADKLDEPSASASVTPTATSAGVLPVGSKLASRLNPSLAAILTRDRSPRLPASTGASTEGLSKSSIQSISSAPPNDVDSESLTHMTKGRAKGPKRRAPKTETPDNKTPAVQVTNTSSVPVPRSTRVDLSQGPNMSKPPSKKFPSIEKRGFDKASLSSSGPAPHDAESAEGTQIVNTLNEDNEAPKREAIRSSSARPKPSVATKSSELRRVSSSLSIEQKQRSSPKPSPTPPSKPIWSAAPTALTEDPATPTKAPPANKVVPVKDVSSSNSGTRPEVVMKPKNVGLAISSAAPSKLQGLGMKLRQPSPSFNPVTKPRILTPPPDTNFMKTSQAPQQIKAVLEDYVGLIDKDQVKANFDVQQFLASADQTPEKVKRKQHTIKEVTGDGKKSSMPPQQEHILYEESLYLVTHEFTNGAGASTSEVYLWCGDRTSDASIEDAQLFCRRDAREHNTKLEVVRQGKESSRFLEALGGILITRRSKSSSFYMLCGRRHLGHIVFDEVDMEAGNLCPGYVYLISAHFGKLYLWKGKGAGADEVGSAKLIGMDLGLTGEIEEIEQGLEPDSFWQTLGSKTATQWSADWHQRADMKGYPMTMYRVDHERPGVLGSLWGLTRATSPAKGQAVKATCDRIEAFSQHDLETSAVHILDAYRSLYIMVNSQCSSKAAEFVTAMYLAQDFAMLSPSIQDRPLLPRCYVAMGEPTPDVKACFRRWSVIDGHSLAGNESMCVPLEEVMEALGL